MHRLEAYARLALIFIVALAILYLPVLFFLKRRGKPVSRQISYLGLVCSLFLIAFATIFFTPISFHPVSYTHLDVYKRQLPRGASGLKFKRGWRFSVLLLSRSPWSEWIEIIFFPM